MCAKCVELDERSAHYTALARQITDPQTLDAISRMKANYEAQKRELHPAPPVAE